MAQVIKNRIVKTILWFIVSLFLLLAVAAGAVQFPYIQTKLVNYLSEKYSKMLGYDVSLSNIAIKWFDSVEIGGLEVYDLENNKMIYAEKVWVDFDISAMLEPENHNVDDITLTGAHVYLTKLFAEVDSLQTLNINDFIKRIKALKKRQGLNSRQYLSCDNLEIINSRFSYNDQRRDSISTGFDYYHFVVDSINGKFDQVFTVKDTFSINVKKLTCNDRKTGLDIKNLKSQFAVSQSAMSFRQLDLKVGQSNIKDSLRLEYSSTLDLSDFNNKVKVVGHLDNSIINTNDLGLFASGAKSYNQNFRVSGDLNGFVRSFTIRNANVAFGSGTALKGKIRMTGLPNFQETFIDFDLSNSYVTIEDIKQYVKPKSYSRLEPFEHVSFSASFLGFPTDFVAKGDFYTEYGRISSDINLKLEEDISKSVYSGDLSMQNFDVGGYTQNDIIGAVTLNGNIKGSGFTLETADFKLDGLIEKIGLKGYEYENIETNARFTKEFFEGTVNVDDPNLRLNVNGAIDLRAGLNFFNLQAKLDTANLKVLNLTEEDLFVRSNLDVNARGLKVDNILGGASLLDTYIEYRNNSIQIDSLSIISDKDEEQRIVFLNSNLFNIKTQGEFDFTQVYTKVKSLIKEYELSLKNDSEATAAYYASKSKEKENDFKMDYEVQIKDLNPLLDVFAPELSVPSASRINGSITGGYTSIFALETNIDSITYQNNQFLNNDIQINISKISDSTNVLAMVYLASERQQLSEIGTKDLLFEGIWNNNHIDFEFDIFQTAYDNRALLFGAIDFKTDSTDIRVESSDLQILDKKWQIQSDNRITISGKEVLINNFSIFNQNQRIAIEGAISEDSNKKMVLNIDSLNLDNLNTVINKDLSGVVDGYGEVSNVYDNILIDNRFTINDFEVDGFLIGNLIAASNWNNSTKQSDVNCSIKRLGYKILNLTGTYSPFKEDDLNLTAELNGTEVKVLEPFLDSFFTNFKGTLDGELSITGKLSAPLINGSGLINDAGLHVNYLNTDYNLNGKFYFTDNKIGFQEIEIFDEEENRGKINGYISHTNFRNMGIDLTADINNFQVLNTVSTDNELFYGNGVATGNIHFIGLLNNMNIIASARTEKGTRIYIPIGDTESIEKEEYIDFVDLSGNVDQQVEEVVNKIDLRGLKLDFDLDITPDAYCEIIFDIKSGDIIRGRGNGDLKLEIDTKGEFNMFGDYYIQEGGYNFTLYNLINKEFEILQNSKISWYGDPYQGVLDIEATYNQLASFAPLLTDLSTAEDDINDIVEIRRKYPVNVLLEIDGALLSPSVNFDITTINLPRNIQTPTGNPVDLEFEFLKFKNSIDEQELKRQVFSLIVLRRFSPLQSFQTKGSITNSVSELLSNQLSYWITQVDENLEIDVDFGKLDEEAFNTFQLRLSYTFLDGRLRVTRNGGFTNQANRADVSSIAGDWTVEYLLTDDGKFKVKMYNRTNYNPINPTEENQNTITTGFSLIHTQSFDELSELFKKSRDKVKSDEEEEEQDNTTSSKSEAIIKEDEME